MKIAYFDFYLPYVYAEKDYPAGGAANEWLNWINGLLVNDCNVGLLTFKGAKEMLKDINYPKIEIIELYEPSQKISLSNYLKKLKITYNAIKIYNPDFVIQEVAGKPTGILGIISFLLRKKFIYRVANDIEVDNRINSRLNLSQKFFFKIGIILADLIVCQNSYQLTSLKKKYPRKRIIKILNPINSENKNMNYSIFKNYFAWIGIFGKQKNLKDLYKIAVSMPDVQFKIAGSPLFSVDEETKFYITKLKEINNVEFVGFLNKNDLFNFLNHSIALINTSHYEGFSNTFLEAWKVGVPVISTIRVNPDNIISDNDLGIICQDVEEQIVNIRIFLKEKEQMIEKFKISTIDYLKNKHDSNIIAKQLIENLNCI